MHKYLQLTHSQDCACSVCFVRRLPPEPRASSLSIPCDQCRPASAQRGRITSMRLIAGEWRVHLSSWIVSPASTCAKHTPSQRPPQYWRVYQSIGKPVPFVPIHEPFEPVG